MVTNGALMVLLGALVGLVEGLPSLMRKMTTIANIANAAMIHQKMNLRRINAILAERLFHELLAKVFKAIPDSGDWRRTFGQHTALYVAVSRH